MIDLARWLLVQIADDERHALDATYVQDPDTAIPLVRPSRLLKDCQTKRRIIDRAQRAFDHATAHPDNAADRAAAAGLDHVLRLMAVPYDDQPGYNDAWRP